MVKRNGDRFSALIPCLYMILALAICVASWEASKASAAVVTQDIPQESIRLRILANSDAPQDQWIKRQVRDAIVARMDEWVQGPHTIEEARAAVRAHLGDLHETVGQVLERYGFHYSYQVELGIVPFPTKMYGDRVYPAGDYEALRVTIGKGEGQNWWCVLFPPLCFVDITASEKVEAKADVKTAAAGAGDERTEKDTKSAEAGIGKQTNAKNGGTAKAGKDAAEGSKSAVAAAAAKSSQPPKPEVRFFVWEMLQGLGGWVKSLMA